MSKVDDDDAFFYEGPPLFCGNSEAEARAMAECSTVPEFIAAAYAYLQSPEGQAFLVARTAARLLRNQSAEQR